MAQLQQFSATAPAWAIRVRHDCPEYLVGETMSEQGHLSDLGYEGQFALERRGYSRLQVDEAIAQLRLEVRAHQDGRRDLEDRLSQALDELEHLKLELSAARSNGRPPHEEISERIGQILKLADDEAKSQRAKAEEEIAHLQANAKADTDKLRTDVKAETDKNRAEAQEQAERMLSAAQEQADTTVASAKAEAESARKAANAEAQHVLADATKQAETALATAKSQAKQQLDEATARATAIHDGAERRLNLLMSRHTESMRRLTEIRDVVTSLVAGEADRGSLEDEVARIVAGTAGSEAAPGSRPGSAPGNGRPGGPLEGRHAGGNGQPDGRSGLSTAQRPGQLASAHPVPGPVASGHPMPGPALPGHGAPGHQAAPVPAGLGERGPSTASGAPARTTQASGSNQHRVAPANVDDTTADGFKAIGT
jgi:F0F1-type ATP synthase membrane subunit b/b'